MSEKEEIAEIISSVRFLKVGGGGILFSGQGRRAQEGPDPSV